MDREPLNCCHQEKTPPQYEEPHSAKNCQTFYQAWHRSDRIARKLVPNGSGKLIVNPRRDEKYRDILKQWFYTNDV
ncbi:hypothetical protein DAPPUDRAFT_246336 [Daphnia pulex]|uniref:Uncharacterized protein n=1 Tax=Daphnia pulex TaxID=6669 RepID=E9GQ82_DAPPU|nr:hypothetical protein DAPPUDRAFT_246336 [Daphnia pulex]|eukprot:EFX78391.1 hypothetical protein DAPPUDRAFT_246336 [Daphnia pulex]